MTTEQFSIALRAFCRRRPFSRFVVEFTSGSHVEVRHPEALDLRGELYAMRTPDGGSMVFTADSVACLHDVPTTPTT